MTRIAVVAAVVLVLVPAFASEPGQPLDCSDWVILAPGLTCRDLLTCQTDFSGPALFPCDSLAQPGVGVNAEGDIVGFDRREIGMGFCGGGAGMGRAGLKSFDGVNERLLAYVDERCVDASIGSMDKIDACVADFDAARGRLYFRCTSRNVNGGLYPARVWVGAFEGFATLFDVLQTFQPSSIAFRVPRIPEGMAAADHFDTYWGNLTNPIDFTQAQPLQCNYPASPPQVGDYLTVADTLPNPAAGTGRYYVTAATYQGQTRYGRKASGGRLSGRDPALLPNCVQPEAK